MIRITKWNETFEVAKTRKLVHLCWINVPTGVDSSGYLALVSMGVPGITAFGVFLAICQWSATCRPIIRGSLARSDGKPLTVPQLAVILRMPVDVVAQSVDLLMSPDVGWLQSNDHENANVLCQSANHLPTTYH
tara:strand:- start:113 stop:514 length:402 start_codon:yes stop_codon:yes gene_type:complete